jgi:hypothetical protein
MEKSLESGEKGEKNAGLDQRQTLKIKAMRVSTPGGLAPGAA